MKEKNISFKGESYSPIKKKNQINIFFEVIFGALVTCIMVTGAIYRVRCGCGPFSEALTSKDLGEIGPIVPFFRNMTHKSMPCSNKP